ncbi:MAG TPA: cobalamin-dependent protein [Nitrososphaerales archaeon]
MPNLSELLADLSEETVLSIVGVRVKDGGNPSDILEELRSGMDIIGQRFANSEYSLAELMMGAEIFRECMDLIQPSLDKSPASMLGRIVIGTVKGDIHNLGKNIVSAMLRAAGFEVHDIGINQSSEQFVEKAREVDADIIGLSCLMTNTLDSMRKTVMSIKGSGLTSKVMVGGGVFNRGVGDTSIRIEGADGFGKNAIESVYLAKKLTHKD